MHSGAATAHRSLQRRTSPYTRQEREPHALHRPAWGRKTEARLPAATQSDTRLQGSDRLPDRAPAVRTAPRTATPCVSIRGRAESATRKRDYLSRYLSDPVSVCTE